MVVSLNNAIVTPQDGGTGLSSPDNADYTSAGHQAVQHTKTNQQNYVETGLDMTATYGENDTVDITAGLVHINNPNTIQVQDQNGDYVNDIDHGITSTVAVPSASSVPLSADTVNDIYLSVDPSTNNAAEYVVRPADTFPSEPYLHIGSIDTAAQEVRGVNRRPSGEYEDLDVEALTAEGLDISGWDVIDASNHGYPGDGSGGDIVDLFLQYPDHHFVLPGDVYSVQQDLDLTNDADWSRIAIVGKGDTTLRVDSENVDYPFRIGNSNGTMEYCSIRGLTVDISESSGYDCGIGEFYVTKQVDNRDLELAGRRNYNELYTNSTDTSGNKFSYFACVVEPSGFGRHTNIRLPDGDAWSGDTNNSHAIGMASDPPHVGTQVWEGCYVAQHWDNGMYIKGGDGTNILIGPVAHNNGRANVRIGENDTIIGGRSVWDMDSSHAHFPANDGSTGAEDGFGVLLACDRARGTSVRGMHLDRQTGQIELIRVWLGPEQITLRDLYVQNALSQNVIRVSESPGHQDVPSDTLVDQSVAQFDGLFIEEDAGATNKAQAVLSERSHLVLNGVTYRNNNRTTDRSFVAVDDGNSVRITNSSIDPSPDGWVLRGDYSPDRFEFIDSTSTTNFRIGSAQTVNFFKITGSDLRDLTNIFDTAYAGSEAITDFVFRDNPGWINSTEHGVLSQAELHGGTVTRGGNNVIASDSGERDLYIASSEPSAWTDGDLWGEPQ